MPIKREPSSPGGFRQPERPFILALAVVNALFLFFLLSQTGSTSAPTTLRDRLKRAEDALPVHFGYGTDDSGVPSRLRRLRQKNEIIGEHLGLIKSGTETVEEVLHGTKKHSYRSDKPPMALEDIRSFLEDFLKTLHAALAQLKRAQPPEIWEVYHDLAVKTLYPWDREYLQRMPERRSDGSIFVSLGSYRDEQCVTTMKGAYEKAKNPEKLFVGLVQQNCERNCMSGLREGKYEKVNADEDCYEAFCASPEGKPHCDSGRVRLIRITDAESLGPYAARFFASKLWYGEEWYMQIDSHMSFAKEWDAQSIEMLKKAPSHKPVLSHYPPASPANLERTLKHPAPRICGPVFAESEIESQIIRLDEAGVYDRKHVDVPRFAPFVAAGYFLAHSEFLRDVPFDPLLPWIFMGEEIIMSARLYTSGYDIFSPTHSVIDHSYGRLDKPKFWESVHHLFWPGVHNPLQMLVLERIKFQMKYPESARDEIKPKSILTAVEQYSMGTARSLDRYLDLAGLDMNTKEVRRLEWCFKGEPPKGFEQYATLYK